METPDSGHIDGSNKEEVLQVVPRHATQLKAAQSRYRLTVVETIYHRGDRTTTATESKFIQGLTSDEQPYKRITTIGEEWTPLDCGWLKECSTLSISNEEGKRWEKNPTPEEMEEMESRVVELGITKSFMSFPVALVRPTQSLRFEPTDVTLLSIRCHKGKAKITITLFPV